MLSRLLLGFLSLIALASGSVLLVIPRPVLYGAGQALPTAHLGSYGALMARELGAMLLTVGTLLAQVVLVGSPLMVKSTLRTMSLPLFLIGGLRCAESYGLLPEGPVFSARFSIVEGVVVTVGAGVCLLSGTYLDTDEAALRAAVGEEPAHVAAAPEQQPQQPQQQPPHLSPAPKGLDGPRAPPPAAGENELRNRRR